jgi:hypothetical protein
MNEKVVSDLKQKLEKTESEIYEKDYSFHLATIEIKEDGEFKKFFNNIEDTKDSVVLWGREKQAFLNIVSYSTELAESLNKKGFIKKIIETPIPAEDEQAFADMIAYSLNSLNSYCKSVFPPRLQPLCSKVGVRDYFKSKELRQPELSYLGYKDSKFMITCPIASESVNKSIPISLSYEKREPTVLFNGNEVNIDFEGDESLVFNKPIGEIKISKNEDDSIITEFHESSTKPKVKKEESLDRMTQCNTLAKLGAKNCQDFLKYLEKKYFSAKK